jgi:alcohol dehydrogenase
MGNKMQAVVYHGDGIVQLEERDIPQIREPGDVILRVTRASICASDLHIRHGAVPRARTNIVLGHEFVGEVVTAGAGVKRFQAGDRVAVNCETFCGECFFCKKGFINNCVQGGWELGCRIDGCHAEFTRIPYADNCLTPIPEQVSDENALFIGDILSSGYFGAELAEIKPGDTVAILGAGPVGICSMICARLFGPAQIVAVDVDDHRLKLVMENKLADVTINPLREDAAGRVKELTRGRGADAVVEVAGGKDTFQAAWQIARPNASIAIVAMYEEAQTLPLHQMYGKNLKFKTGGVDAVHFEDEMQIVAAGKIDTGLLITHRAPLNNVMEGYRVFGERLDNCMKWVITPFER